MKREKTYHELLIDARAKISFLQEKWGYFEKLVADTLSCKNRK